ncbi:MAG: sugar phosphate isomerase/epimerase family protein [Acutalibacteraceae bacterium]
MMKLGAQLFTLRNYLQNEKDFAFCMKEVAAMGYKTVQISGAGPLPAKFMREVCDENGLSIVLTHIDGEKLLRHTDEVIRDHEILGCDYIGIGSMPERYRTPEWVHHFADDYLPVAREIRAAGKYFMYHHHNFEFEKFPGGRFIEILLDSFAPEEMGITLDTYWLAAAGVNPVEWVEKLKDRIPCVHLKDLAVRGWQTTFAPVGEGNLNFPAILKKMEEVGTVKYMLVEQDTCEESPFVCLKKSHDAVRAMGYTE